MGIKTYDDALKTEITSYSDPKEPNCLRIEIRGLTDLEHANPNTLNRFLELTIFQLPEDQIYQISKLVNSRLKELNDERVSTYINLNI